MTLSEVLTYFRENSVSEKQKGTQFERLMKAWLQSDPRYCNLFTKVWMWEDFPSKADLGGNDTGIDLVALDTEGEYWAIQCKCYAASKSIDKPDVDSFLSTSGRSFIDELGQTKRFGHRLWISTTNKWGSNAEEAIQGQDPGVLRVNLSALEISPVDWDKLLSGKNGKEALQEGKKLRKHQLDAIAAAEKHYEENDRGKLVMACGTGKTFTSLKLVEQLLGDKGLVLFMVPSIALLGQSLNDWMADAKNPIKAICICSDARASKKVNKDGNKDDEDNNIVDIALPATTDSKSVVRQLNMYRNHNGLVVVFSTYQSIDAIGEAQKEILKQTNGEYGVFDFIVCDEAHRTTGVKISDKDESNFIKIHRNENVEGKKRLYMTATPRLYGESAKIKASKNDCILCSMDDEEVYGKEFFRVNFSYAVQNGLLTDYKVLVLTVTEDLIPENILREVKNNAVKELNYDDTGRLIGVINGLSKNILGDKGLTWEQDPRMMHRALAFCSKIGSTDQPGTSKNVAAIMPRICELYEQNLNEEERERVVHIKARHVDGSMGAMQRNDALQWLKEESEDPQECRVITNVRCLSEGVDVPALDAVLFMSARNSQVDVVQSVGRVMRSFKKGKQDEKKYGYIIIPVVVPENTKPEDALNDNVAYSAVWDILNALRSHDDNFNAHVNTIALNHDKGTKVTIGLPGFGQTGLGQSVEGGDQNDQNDATTLTNAQVARQLEIQFGGLQDGIFAKLVEKCGDRLYWENWAGEVGQIARKFIERINRQLKDGDARYKEYFDEFVKALQANLNPGITPDQCVEMLAQHIITRPVFDALFSEYQFINNNSISSSMQMMIELLEEDGVNKDLESLQSFYESVRKNIGKIDNLEGKQTVIKNLYEKFFKKAFPLTVEKLGTVYTPVECVDFIIRSVDMVLKKEFGTALTNEGVHILDPFTGTGTFMTRLLQTGVISKDDIVRKYKYEIHCNEIVLLAYYIADVNIESVFQEQYPQVEYLPFNGICLTDTFQLGENNDGDLFKDFFKENAECVEEQKKAKVRVIIGNPPYSIGQKSANDDAQNQHYPVLEDKIAKTYVADSTAGLSKGIYDSYIKAFRWATDRIESKEGGVIAYISNGAWIDGNALDGFRSCLEKDFDKIYVFNLRGNQRTSGELSRREGGKIFGSGSRTPIAITILIKYPEDKRTGNCIINYHDIGDYLTREQKLKIIKDFGTYDNIDWSIIEPNDKHDWINQRDGSFDTLIPLVPEKKFVQNSQSCFSTNAIGIATNRDAWVTGFSQNVVSDNMRSMIDFYNSQLGCEKLSEDVTKISWTRGLKNQASKKAKIEFDNNNFAIITYRPFIKLNLYNHRVLIESPGIFDKIFVKGKNENLVITVSGIGGSKPFSCLITNDYPCLDLNEKTQCFPLYWYKEKEDLELSLFDEVNEGKYQRMDGISDWMLKEVRSRYNGARGLTKEDIFYYVYGILHSQEYRDRFADDLRKSLPRIPITEKIEDFLKFVKAGQELAKLHLNYENYKAPESVRVVGDRTIGNKPVAEDYQYFRIDKLRFPKKGQKDTIIYNGNISIENIPEEAYSYIVNGKSAIEWVMEKYIDNVDKATGIHNDANMWGYEHNNPRYILDLVLSIIYVSCQTQKIVSQLPKLSL